ncbi:signal peptidase I [Rathayibacter sp. YIM 133350]|uniref:signal peptidase I n=1 Tax=Rathayibacter sp. YIM 133350 TaxID=3131992 RepID=UPI00307FB28E
MNVLRRLATTVLWACAAVGIVCALVWATTAVGLIKPLVVISGSMEPGIMTGDLLIDTKAPASSVKAGDVVSLHSALTGALVTHRVKAVADAGSTITLKGDANAYEDPEPYRVGTEVWQPTIQLAGMGTLVSRLTTPAVAFPLIIGLFALLALILLLPAPPAKPSGRRSAAVATERAVAPSAS